MSSSTSSSMQKRPEVTIRLLREEDLPVADRIVRLAFGTFLGLPDPMKFMGDADYVRTRWLADPSAAFGAEFEGELVGTNFATRWGSVGFFGPLTIRPDLWDRGIAQQLLATHDGFIREMGNSPRGPVYVCDPARSTWASIKNSVFGPGFLLPLMEMPIEASPLPFHVRWKRFSELSVGRKAELSEACAELDELHL